MRFELIILGLALVLSAIAVVISFAAMTRVDQFAAGVQADFFECPPNNTLVVCAVGTSPPAADMCESVGSGTTTITPNNCG